MRARGQQKLPGWREPRGQVCQDDRKGPIGGGAQDRDVARRGQDHSTTVCPHPQLQRGPRVANPPSIRLFTWPSEWRPFRTCR